MTDYVPDPLAYILSRGWRESVRANDPGWYIDPIPAGLCLYTLAEAFKIQRERDDA